MKLKKIGILALMFLALSATSLMAQPGGGGGGGGMSGGGGGGGRQEGGMQSGESTINILESAGFFELDAKQILKKIKVKDPERKAAVTKALVEYAEGYERVAYKYEKEIEAIKVVQKRMEASGSSSRDMMQSVSESSTKIRNEMVVLHKKINDTDMPTILEEKELLLWIKYYSTLCQTKGFSLNQQRNQQRNQQGGSRPQR